MKMKVENGFIFAKTENKDEEKEIKSWRLMQKDPVKKWWYGKVSITLLEKIRQAHWLMPDAKKEYEKLVKIRDAVDVERMRPAEDLKPLVEIPVKEKLYMHQIRAVNMAMLIFQMIEPPSLEQAG